MKIEKGARAESGKKITSEDLARINSYSKKELTEEDIFTFEILLCDNDVDRDFERFSNDALYELKELFIGKTGIFDHEWSSTGQKARIYKTEVVTDDTRSTVTGESYSYLKAAAYMLRSGNEELINEIEGGIKKEVSVGCSMKAATCSICGNEREGAKCGHIPGTEYDGRLCYVTLSDAQDAYEWSFVAVPAQKNAGIIKKFGVQEKITSHETEENNETINNLKSLAELGEKYISGLKNDVIRLGIMTGDGYSDEFLKSVTDKLSEDELISIKKVFEHRLNELMPPTCQFKKAETTNEHSDEEFII